MIEENDYKKEMHQSKVQHARVGITLNTYQLANVLHALRTAEPSGDWYLEVLYKIESDLREQGLSLPEFHRGEEDEKCGMIQIYNNAPNISYPENFVTKMPPGISISRSY